MPRTKQNHPKNLKGGSESAPSPEAGPGPDGSDPQDVCTVLVLQVLQGSDPLIQTLKWFWTFSFP